MSIGRKLMGISQKRQVTKPCPLCVSVPSAPFFSRKRAFPAAPPASPTKPKRQSARRLPIPVGQPGRKPPNNLSWEYKMSERPERAMPTEHKDMSPDGPIPATTAIFGWDPHGNTLNSWSLIGLGISLMVALAGSNRIAWRSSVGTVRALNVRLIEQQPSRSRHPRPQHERLRRTCRPRSQRTCRPRRTSRGRPDGR